MKDQEFNVLLGNLDKRCATCIAPFMVMLAIADKANRTPHGIITDGTGSLFNTGSFSFLVTNNHVYEPYQTRRAASDGIVLLLCWEEAAWASSIFPRIILSARTKTAMTPSRVVSRQQT